MRFLNYAGGVFILLLLALGCKPEAKRSRVFVIQSFRWGDKSYPELNSGIRTFYLDCECYMAEEEEERMYNFIDTIRLWNPDIISVNDDQVTYTLMECGCPFVKKVPVVFSGVNFPNWDLLEEYPNVTGSWDKIDYKENLRLIDQQMGKSRIYINNAIKFTTSGYIEVGYYLCTKGDCFHIYVEDTGIGIPEEKQKQVFDHICKLDEFAQGTGLELAICQVIAQHFDGEIQLNLENGKESRFTLTLPKERIG